MAHRTTALTDRFDTCIPAIDSPGSAVIDAVRRGARPSAPTEIRPANPIITVVPFAGASVCRLMKKAQ